FSWVQGLLFWPAIPLLLVGFLGNFLPLFAADRLTRKFIKDITFRASTALAAGLVFYVLYFLAILVAGLVKGGIWGGVLAAMLPLAGWGALRLWEWMTRWLVAFRIKTMPREVRADLDARYEKADQLIRALINESPIPADTPFYSPKKDLKT
ncbi:MAG: hypothetical protein D6714_12975, partial [Bacteroidetes bacterium]